MKRITLTPLDWGLYVLLILFAIATLVVFLGNGNNWAVQVLAACLGAVITILATRMLLDKQSKIEKEGREAEDKAKKNQDFYNATLQVYSDYVSEMYEALSDNHVTSEELMKLRTKLFATVGFYAEEGVLKEIYKKMKDVFFKNNETLEGNRDIDSKMSFFFSGITEILQNDIKMKSMQKNEEQKTNNKTPKADVLKDEKKDSKDKEDIMQVLWTNFQEIINKLIEQEEKEKEGEVREKEFERAEQKAKQETELLSDIQSKDSSNDTDSGQNQEQKIEAPIEHSKRLKQQAWHFIMWGDKQLEKLKEGFTELSLVEYGEYWRTNLVKQVREGDIIMLFRRGGGGYIGAYKAIGRRVFIREDNVVTEEYLKFGEDRIVKAEEYWNGEGIIYEDKETVKHLKKFDIYDSILGDGATSCANIIVEPIAFKEGGVGNPGGVYRRTISRYDSLYAGMLMQRFEKAGVIIDGKENDYELYVS